MNTKTTVEKSSRARRAMSRAKKVTPSLKTAFFRGASAFLDETPQRNRYTAGTFKKSPRRALLDVHVRHDKALRLLNSQVEHQEAEITQLRRELAALRRQITRPVRTQNPTEEANEVAAPSSWQEMLAEGEKVRLGWVESGLLIASHDLAEAWGQRRQALAYAVSRGHLFSIKVGKNQYYPAVFRGLDAETVKKVCSELKGEDASAKFIFWNRRHGGLDGQTPADAIRAGQTNKVCQLAAGWSAERGLAA